MRMKIAVLFGTLLLFACTALFAQESNTDSKAKTRTISGCLSKGDNSASSNEFLLTGSDGSTWEVRSDAVSLTNHVGQMVEATGVVQNSTAHNLKEDAKDAAADAHMKKDSAEHGHMTITHVKTVSESCQK
jgi:hypothetical protein